MPRSTTNLRKLYNALCLACLTKHILNIFIFLRTVLWHIGHSFSVTLKGLGQSTSTQIYSSTFTYYLLIYIAKPLHNSGMLPLQRGHNQWRSDGNYKYSNYNSLNGQTARTTFNYSVVSKQHGDNLQYLTSFNTLI